MNAIDTALRQIAALQGQVTSEIIRDLIAGHKATRERMIDLYERYEASKDGVPIFERTFTDTRKVNRQLNNDFFGEITDTKIGYFMGKPIAYQVNKMRFLNEKGELDKAAHGRIDQVVNDFLLRNNIEDLDAETAKMAAICGLGCRLCYIDREGLERVMAVDPWECIFITDRSLNEAQYAMRYYQMQVQEAGQWVSRWRVEWYDAENVTFYLEQRDGGTYALDPTEASNPTPHWFDRIPLLGFVNNEEQQGDVEKVLPLIDGYDRSLSDVNSEIEQFRLAYMAFYGVELSKEVLEEAQRTGAFGLPATAEGSKIEFITKDLNDLVIEHHLDRLEQNILRFAKSVNFGDEAFAGNISGVAMKFKLFALEAKCITAERKFVTGLRAMFDVISSAWAKKGIEVDTNADLIFDFTRNFPLNLLDEAQTTTALKGLVSEQTRLALLSFVDDVDLEMELMAQEQEGKVDLDDAGDEEEDDEEEPDDGARPQV